MEEQQKNANKNANNFDRYNGKGLTGLANVGNTCYLNSCMQALSHTYEFNDFLDSDYKKHINEKPDTILLLEWDKLRTLMWSKNCNVAPWGFVKAVQRISKLKNREIFSGFIQNDVQEFLLFMLESFHNGLSREVEMTITGKAKNDKDILAQECYKMMKNMFKKDYSEIVKIFYGIQISEIKSIKDGTSLSIKPEPLIVLNLSIPKTLKDIKLIDCLNNYCLAERLEGDNAWFNEKLNEKQDVTKGLSFWSLPQILIIDLKRWDFRGRKDQRLVNIPFELDLTNYVKGYNKDSYHYNLYAICNHSGGSGGGHYTATVKNANGKWYNFNDLNTREIPKEKVVTNQAYCLFYRKIK